MTSIITKFHGPTNFSGSRSDYGSEIERHARSEGRPGRIVVGWNHALNSDENHKRAALASGMPDA